MSSSANSRNKILTRIANARLGNDQETASAAIPRSYDRSGTLSSEARIAFFEQRLLEYGASVVRTDEAGLAACLAAAIARSAVRRIVFPSALPADWRCAGVEWIADDNLPSEQIETAGGVMTAASIAVASTGTIILQHGALEGRRILTLLPDHHFCIVREDQVVESLPEAMEWVGRSPTLPTTLISGPSATADIEMTRIKGVHGPRNLHVILLIRSRYDSAQPD